VEWWKIGIVDSSSLEGAVTPAPTAVPKTRYYIDGAWYDGNGTFISRNKPATSLRNRSVGEEKLYKWVLGETKTGTHCPDCEARAGKVKSIAEWKTMGKPKCKCKCRLVPQ